MTNITPKQNPKTFHYSGQLYSSICTGTFSPTSLDLNENPSHLTRSPNSKRLRQSTLRPSYHHHHHRYCARDISVKTKK